LDCTLRCPGSKIPLFFLWGKSSQLEMPERLWDNIASQWVQWLTQVCIDPLSRNILERSHGLSSAVAKYWVPLWAKSKW
jgi:hypothetical protein